MYCKVFGTILRLLSVDILSKRNQGSKFSAVHACKLLIRLKRLTWPGSCHLQSAEPTLLGSAENQRFGTKVETLTSVAEPDLSLVSCAHA